MQKHVLAFVFLYGQGICYGVAMSTCLPDVVGRRALLALAIVIPTGVSADQAVPIDHHLRHSRSPLLATIDGPSASSPRPVIRLLPADARNEIWRSLAGHSAPTPEVLRAIATAAGATGMDLGILLAAAWKESTFRPSAAAPNSSARGLFQFTTATWREALARHGHRHGLPPPSTSQASAAEISRLRHEALPAALIAAEMIKADGETLAARLGRPITQAEAFLTHFFGLAGAERFLRAVATTPDRDVREVIPVAFANNRARFPEGRGPIPVRAAYDHLMAIIETRRTLYLQLLRLERMLSRNEIAANPEPQR